MNAYPHFAPVQVFQTYKQWLDNRSELAARKIIFAGITAAEVEKLFAVDALFPKKDLLANLKDHFSAGKWNLFVAHKCDQMQADAAQSGFPELMTAESNAFLKRDLMIQCPQDDQEVTGMVAAIRKALQPDARLLEIAPLPFAALLAQMEAAATQPYRGALRAERKLARAVFAD